MRESPGILEWGALPKKQLRAVGISSTRPEKINRAPAGKEGGILFLCNSYNAAGYSGSCISRRL